MPRANRYFVPGHVWHLTQRCHRKEFLLRFAKDRDAWVDWLFEARKRFGLSVLDFTVTSNHVHLVVFDQGRGEIADSMQLIAGCEGRAYNRRKLRRGAFWEDNYHATAIESGDHLARCIAYVDLNMVRAGVVQHPAQWRWGGYHEIQAQRPRFRIIDRERLADLLDLRSTELLASTHTAWIEAALRQAPRRQAVWSESLAIGSRDFVQAIASALASRALHREVVPIDELFCRKEAPAIYAETQTGILVRRPFWVAKSID